MNVFFSAVTIVALTLVICILLSWPVMLLWNSCLVPAISGLHEIELLQAFGILILCGFLFKSEIKNK